MSLNGNINHHSTLFSKIRFMVDFMSETYVVALWAFILDRLDYQFEGTTLSSKAPLNILNLGKVRTVRPDIILQKFTVNNVINTIIVTECKVATGIGYSTAIAQNVGEMIAAFHSSGFIQERYMYGLIIMADQVKVTRLNVDEELVNFIARNGIITNEVLPVDKYSMEIYSPGYGYYIKGQVLLDNTMRISTVSDLLQFKQHIKQEFNDIF